MCWVFSCVGRIFYNPSRIPRGKVNLLQIQQEQRLYGIGFVRTELKFLLVLASWISNSSRTFAFNLYSSGWAKTSSVCCCFHEMTFVR